MFRAIRSGGRSLAIPDAIDAALVGLFGNKIEPKPFTNDTGKKPPHRMLLPFRGSHNGNDRCAAR
jgi:hypothetical protein